MPFFADIVEAEAAIVRPQFVSGTHAIACALYGVLRPGDELLSIAGTPYDTLEEVIGLRGQGQGSLAEFGISYRELALTPAATIDWNALATAINANTKLVLIQRSCGYSWRSTLTITEIEKVIRIVKGQNPDVVCFVDNCYGEFLADREPPAVGADLIAGSLIKNPGGTIATTGGYVAGRADLVEAAACRLTAPGIGRAGGSSLNQNRLMYQGLFLAPQMVGEAMKGNYLLAKTFADLGYLVNPSPDNPQRDVIQAIQLGSAEKLIAFCKAVQQHSPIDAYVEPVPAAMPGYDSELVMAGGTFIDGSTSELSADGPLREPYIVYCQGGQPLDSRCHRRRSCRRRRRPGSMRLHVEWVATKAPSTDPRHCEATGYGMGWPNPSSAQPSRWKLSAAHHDKMTEATMRTNYAHHCPTQGSPVR